jgi:hypothetical protein
MRARIAVVLIAGLLVAGCAEADTFDGYECLDDCSGHQAGFDWAEQNQITDESSCSTPSNSFNEGCTSYVQGGGGNVESDEEADDDEDE